ncbi:MAG TPA: winged helix-turn-helix transcriptional regulator [Saprospiraceae bacterium]|nr:winged helix-turn-helix transcriptional regulator [Saprospiraceae bacterium]
MKELELNGMIRRTVYDSIPVTVEYELTKSGESLSEVLESMMLWGLEHRKNMIRK